MGNNSEGNTRGRLKTSSPELQVLSPISVVALLNCLKKQPIAQLGLPDTESSGAAMTPVAGIGCLFRASRKGLSFSRIAQALSTSYGRATHGRIYVRNG